MKLLTKSTIYFILTTIIVFLISGVTVYFLMQNFIRSEIDESLLDKKSEFFAELREIKSFSNFVLSKDSTLIIGQPLNIKANSLPVFGDTLLNDVVENELTPHRYIKFLATINNESRYVTIYQSLIESEDIVEGIFFSLLIVFLIMILAISVLNIFGMRHVWQPFRKTLEQIKVFDFSKNKTFESVPSDITEFAELNAELKKMTTKLSQDYLSLKEFSENASHEMQTPLAIIQSKLELLFQKQIGDENLKVVSSAYQAANRLSKLHQELNLLTRIENQEYKDLQEIDIKLMIEKQIENFRDILELKSIKLNTSVHSTHKVKANEYLLGILFSNLFSNAIKHNLSENGTISIEFKEKTLTISNTGQEPENALESLFERFKKGQPGSESTGLGLALAKQICSVHNFGISYSYQDGMHNLKIEF